MIQKLLDISTAHITESTAEWLAQRGKDRQELTVYNKRVYNKFEHGFFILVETLEKDEIKEMPNDFQTVVKYAQKKKCEWIMLDCDGDTIDDLPKYDW